MIKKKLQNNGFTLIEILATIAILGIVIGIVGYYVTNSINSSKEKSEALAIANIKTTAKIYVEENPNDIVWAHTPNTETETETEDYSYSCISINLLINKGYIKEKQTKEHNLPNYVIVNRNNTTYTLFEELDTKDFCKNSGHIVKIPTAKEYCNDLTYDGSEHTLASYPDNLSDDQKNSFYFENNLGKNADNYTVKAILESEHIWEDGTDDEIDITCSIKKATPELEVTPSGIDFVALTTKEFTPPIIKSSVDGTLKLKTSNKDYIKASFNDNNLISANIEKELMIEPLSSRNTSTTITITLTPNDTNNYNSSSTTFTIENINQEEITPPTAEKYCKKDLKFNNNTQTLINQDIEHPGFTFYNITGLNVGSYTITAKLKYGYIWNEGENRTENRTITCTINEATPTVTYDSNGGNSCNPTTKTVTYKEKYGTLCTPTRTGYKFKGWYTSKTKGTEITSDTTVTNYNDHTIYAQWTINTVYVKYNVNGGNIKATTTATDGTIYMWTTDNDGVIYKSTDGGTATAIMHTYNYGATMSSSGLANWDNNAYMNITRAGYKAVSGAEWICLSGDCTVDKTFSDSTAYEVSELCDASSASCTVVLGVNWTPKTYTVTLNNQSATSAGTTSVTATYGNAMPTITKPTKKYTVSYNANGGSVSTSNNTATYTFGGYYTSTGGSGTQYYNSSGGSAKNWNLTQNTTLYAKWTSSSVTLPTPTRSGYTFNGWYTSASGGSKVGNAGTSYTPTNTITLYARWTKNTAYYAVTTTDIWNLYKSSGYILNAVSEKITYYGTNPKTVYGASINRTNYETILKAQYFGTIKNNQTVYVEVDGNNKIVEYKQVGTEEFYGIYVKDGLTANPYGCGLSSLPTKTINGSTYYHVWINADCQADGTTCDKDKSSLKFN